VLGHGESTIGCSYSYLLTLAIGTLIATTLPQIASIDHLSRLHHDNTMATANGLNGTHSEKPEYDAIVVGAGFAFESFMNFETWVSNTKSSKRAQA